MKKTVYAIWRDRILHYLTVQLFISLASLPLLVWWGLPLSGVSILTNFALSPFLLILILLSSLLFFTELLHIPNGYLIVGFEYLCSWIAIVLQHTPSSFLYAFAKPSLFVALFPLCAAFVIIHFNNLSPLRRTCALACAFVISIFLFSAAQQSLFHSIPIGREHCLAVACKQGLVCIDAGAFKATPLSRQWIEYSLTSDLIQHYGTAHVTILIELSLSARIVDNLILLCSTLPIQQVYIPFWQGDLDSIMRKKMRILKSVLNKKKIALHSLANTLILNTKDGSTLLLEKTTTMLTYKNLAWPAYRIVHDGCAITTSCEKIY